MFTTPVAYQAEEVGVAPLRSIAKYCRDQETLQTGNSLREAGLSEGEVHLVMGGDGRGKAAGVRVEPSAMQARMDAVQEVCRNCTCSWLQMYICRSCRAMPAGWKRLVVLAVVFWQ